METIYFDIRNGDVAVYYDENDKFIGADVIKCGEWSSYSTDEEKEFLWLMKYWGINLENEKKKYFERRVKNEDLYLR